MLRTRHEWIGKLAAESSVIPGMHLEAEFKNADLDTDAFNLANCDAHCRLIARAIDELVTHEFSSKESAGDLLGNLIARNTYGAFAEIAAYDWLTRCCVRIKTQVAMAPGDVLAAQGSTLDGKIVYDDDVAYFDVKAFGANGRLAQRLKKRLEEEIPCEEVLVEESWDLSFETFQDLIGSASGIASELRQKRMVHKGRLRIRLEAKKPVTVSSRQVDPYCLARQNAFFPYKKAQQFTRNKPFILMFVVHPWFNAGFGVDPTFTRALARRAFMQFSTDSTPLNTISKNVPSDVTLAEASRLLSAIFFVNVWPLDADSTITRPMRSWLYLNPRATHHLSSWSVSLFRANNPPCTYIDAFADDDY
jgi:hypothetical protein